VSEIPKIARGRLRQQAAGAGNHPDADQMTAFLERSLGAREREQVLGHLSRCAECREVAALSLSLPPEEAARLAEAAPQFRWFEWQTLRWAAVAATFVIAVSLVFQSYRETPARYSTETAQNRPVAAPPPAPAEAAKPPVPTRTDEGQPSQAFGVAKEKAPSSSTVAVLRDQETEVARGPSKLDSVNRAKIGRKSGELAVGSGVGGGIAGGRMDDDKKLGSEGKTETSNGTLAAKAATVPAPAMATGSRRGPAAPAQQQQVAGLAQQPAPSPPATREEVQRQAAAEPAWRASADRAEVAKVTGQNETVNVESVEKDADQRARNAAPAGAFAESRKMTTSVAATLRWVITAEGHVQRSMDSGSTWKSVTLDNRIRFRAVAAAGSDVWAGGEGGALYHSSDSGNTWTRVSLPAELASATIVRVEFTDARRGTLATSSGESWATSDGGATWQKK
jgi:hypothetical protein